MALPIGSLGGGAGSVLPRNIARPTGTRARDPAPHAAAVPGRRLQQGPRCPRWAPRCPAGVGGGEQSLCPAPRGLPWGAPGVSVGWPRLCRNWSSSRSDRGGGRGSPKPAGRAWKSGACLLPAACSPAGHWRAGCPGRCGGAGGRDGGKLRSQQDQRGGLLWRCSRPEPPRRVDTEGRSQWPEARGPGSLPRWVRVRAGAEGTGGRTPCVEQAPSWDTVLKTETLRLPILGPSSRILGVRGAGAPLHDLGLHPPRAPV